VLTQEDWNEVLYNGMENTSVLTALKWVIILILEVIQIDMEKLIHSKLEELFTGDIDITDNSHDLISDETESHKTNNLILFQEVKIMSILKKIAISNKNDSSLRVVENQLNKSSNSNSNNSSPYKSIIKIRSSKPQSLSSSTTQSFHTSLNYITLAMEHSLIPTTSPERQFLNLINIIFTIEMPAKVMVSEFIFGLHTYLLISRVPGLKLVVQTLLSSLRLIGYIVVICCTFFFYYI
ncbi:unnamed protein product, partial [Rotaria sp. Silwood1]